MFTTYGEVKLYENHSTKAGNREMKEYCLGFLNYL